MYNNIICYVYIYQLSNLRNFIIKTHTHKHFTLYNIFVVDFLQQNHCAVRSLVA